MPFCVSQEIGVITYKLALPPTRNKVHNAFHVTILRKCIPDPDQIFKFLPQHQEKDLSYTVKILEVQNQELN